ncbi:gliding motility-associated C-terminal domain-containing protein [Flavobacterium sp. RHBU_3]|uniref:T9SS type B sorting domain-containing protein n=1 Tax=Flavobacterium sp. RHBU_3 TaxID=3391184 RepID=UPI003984C477
MRNLICLLLLTLPVSLLAQKQAAIWYFGGQAGLDFNNGAPVALTNSALTAGEGCSTVSTADGQLLFYTNGVNAYNQNHLPLANSDYQAGSNSSTQSSIIIPKPGSTTIYYIFTTNSMDGYLPMGLNYYTVDMTQNSGLGSITEVNGGPLGPSLATNLASPVAEKLTAVHHTDGESIWVISHKSGSSDFIAFLVSSSGVNETPVVSSVGSVHNYLFIQSMLWEENNLPGEMKTSPDGTKLAVAKEYLTSNFVTSPTISGGVELFDFDASTGIVSNPRNISTRHSYGIEFSPDSKLLYATSGVNIIGTWNTLLQYDTSSGTEAGIQATETTLFTSSPWTPGVGGLQLGIDGKLYVAKLQGGTSLHVVNNPNIPGTACNFQEAAISLGGKSCYNALPNFITSWFQAQTVEFNGICEGTDTNFEINSYATIVSANWDFGDPASGSANTSTDITPTHNYTQAGTYSVNVTFENTAGITATRTIPVTITAAPVTNTVTNLRLCSDENTATFNLSAQTAAILGAQSQADFTVTYHTSQADADSGSNAITGDLSAYSSGAATIFVRVVSGATGCLSTTSFNLIIDALPTAGQATAITLCDDATADGFTTFDLTQKDSEIINGETASTVAYYTTQADAEAGINAITTPAAFTNTVNPQTIYAALTNAAGCNAITSFSINVQAAPVTGAATNLTACETTAGSGSAQFDLTLQEATIINGQTGVTVTYYTSQADAEAGTNAITTPTAFNNTTNPQTVYAAVTNALGCSSYTTFSLGAFALPVAGNVSNILVCETTTGSGNGQFDLTQQNAALINGQAGVTVAYYTTQADAEAGTNAIATPVNFVNTINPQTIYTVLTNANGCSSYVTFAVNATALPVAGTVTGLNLCEDADGSATAQFDLTQQETALINGQAGITLAYYTTMADAETGNNAIALPTGFTNTQNPQPVYVSLTNAAGCKTVTSFNLNVTPLPQPGIANNMSNCDGIVIDGSAEFDLTEQNADIINGQQGLTVSYFTSQQDADNNTNAIVSPNTFVNTQNPQTVYARLNNGNCYGTTSFTLTVLDGPEISTPLVVEGCTAFDLTIAEALLSPENIYDYYASEHDAQAGTNAIASPETYAPGVPETTVYIRAENNNGCFSIAPVSLVQGNCEIPRGISPGDNDYNNNFDLTNFDVKHISIFNRYGLEVYSYNGTYTNQWNGQTNNGNDLPTGTYFYAFENNRGKSFTGWVYINRNN